MRTRRSSTVVGFRKLALCHLEHEELWKNIFSKKSIRHKVLVVTILVKLDFVFFYSMIDLQDTEVTVYLKNVCLNFIE